jgi:alkylation response protein AidB-like acyl-CoA dehydrogenase
VDFSLGHDADAVRIEARSFLAEALTPELKARMHRTGTHWNPDFTQRLRERGWIAPGWEEEFGGQGWDPLQVQVLAEELRFAFAPMYGISTTLTAASALRHLGTAKQKAEVLPRAVRGEIVIALGWTEPECGSDLAAAKTRAVRDRDGWRINGQKMFTTNAHVADYIFVLARTNPDVPKHDGLTTFLVPTDQPGVEVQELRTISGERTNIVFFGDARVPDSYRVGEVDKGWSVMGVALTYERTYAHGADSLRLLRTAETWGESTIDDAGRTVAEDPAVSAEIGRTATEAEVALLLGRRTAWVAETGKLPGVEGSMAKLFSSEALVRQAESWFGLLGPDAVRCSTEPVGEPDSVEEMIRFAQASTVYGGTSEIQRGIIAHRGLGLPRSR